MGNDCELGVLPALVVSRNHRKVVYGGDGGVSVAFETVGGKIACFLIKSWCNI